MDTTTKELQQSPATLLQQIQDGSIQAYDLEQIPATLPNGTAIFSPWSLEDLADIYEDSIYNCITLRQAIENHKQKQDQKKTDEEHQEQKPKPNSYQIYQEQKEVKGKRLSLERLLIRMERGQKIISHTRSELEQAGARYLQAKSLEYMRDPEKAKEFCTSKVTVTDKNGNTSEYDQINTGLLNHLDHMSKRLADGAEKLERGKLNKEEQPQLQLLNINTTEGKSLESIQAMSFKQLLGQKPSDM